ncbi:MAG TPA: pyridoxal phosphate-dependent aminotransferase [Bryobacteraceae bacterium]|nr:pyridoxal phosphate-dependent aminotransferase [Bryobacteraceae bacterium]
MFSFRFRWDFQPNRLTRAIDKKRAEGAEILDLTESNPTKVGLHYPAEIVDAFREQRLLRYEPSPAGLGEAREAVAQYYFDRGIAVEPERILLTASTSEAYAYLFKLLTDPGDNVLVPRPSYPLFEFLATMESVEVRSYPLRYHGHWALDLQGLLAALTERTRGVIVVNPNNPTGSFVKRGELDELTRICKKREIALISDEVFADYAFAPDSERVVTLAGQQEGLAFSMSGLSKIAGLPQMKLGWIVTAGAAHERQQARDRLEWIADTYLSVGTPVQCAAARLLRAGQSIQQQIRARTAENLRLAREALEGSAAGLLNVEGGWCATIQVPKLRTEEEWALGLLESANVLFQPGFFYDFDGEAFLVCSLLTAPAVFREGLKRLILQVNCT